MGSKGGSPHLTPPLCPQSGAAEGEEGLRGPRRALVPGVPEQTEAEQCRGVKPPPPCTLFICASPLPARGASLTPGAGPSSCCLRPPSLPLHTRVQPLVALIKSPVLNWSDLNPAGGKRGLGRGLASPRRPGTAQKVSWGSETKGVKAGPVAPHIELSLPHCGFKDAEDAPWDVNLGRQRRKVGF